MSNTQTNTDLVVKSQDELYKVKERNEQLETELRTVQTGLYKCQKLRDKWHRLFSDRHKAWKSALAVNTKIANKLDLLEQNLIPQGKLAYKIYKLAFFIEKLVK